jgi:putative ABC transport system permease protein
MWRRLLSLFRRERLEGDLSDEVEFHIAMLAEEKKKLGLDSKEALSAARRDFGGVEQMKENYRDARGLPLIESIIADGAHAARMMRANASFSIAVIVTLAIGIGATTAVFTIANAVLVEPLQIPSAGRTVVLLSTNPREGTEFSVAEGVFADWRARSGSFDAIAGAWNTSMILSGAGQAHEVDVIKVTADFFQIAGLRACEGHLFDSSVERSGHELVAVLDEGFWRREFGGNRNMLGEHIRLDDQLYTVIGIVPSSFALGHPRRADVWVPLVARAEARSGGAVNVIARLRPEVTATAAQAEMNVIHDQIGREHRQDSPFGVNVRALQDWVVSEARPSLVMLAGAVALLMLMCCVNIASLLLARASFRQREFAIRASLGGGHARLTRQVLTENLVLAAVGGVAGFILSVLLVRAVPYIRGIYLPRLDEIQPDGRMLFIAAAVTIASGLLFGLVPAWRGSIASPRTLMGAVAAAIAVTPGAMRLRRGLVVAQIGLSLMLLCGAGLLLNSFIRLVTTSVGFSKANVVAARLRLPYKRYDAARSLVFHRRMIEEIRALPGVLDVSAADHLPLQAVRFPYQISVDEDRATSMQAMARNVESHYFHALGIPMAVGREFEAADDERSPVPVILNVDAARRLFGGERDAIGRNLKTNYRQRKVLEVIGVASNVKQLGLRENPGPQIYLPMKFGSGGYVIARIAENAGDLSAAIRDAVFRLDAAVPAPEVSSVGSWFEREIGKPRMYLLILGVFAAAGLVIATTGVYGVVAYNVARRTHEFGVRLALGAKQQNILQLVVARESVFILAGIALGAAGAHWTNRLLTTLVYGVRPGDASTLAGAALLLMGVALLACYLPARRAMRLDPAAALRDE